MSLERRLTLLAYLVLPGLFGFMALVLGQDTNWDLRNYHYYNPYAFLHGRLDIDIAPAQLQSYYNPLLDIPIYFAITFWPPKLMGFVLGVLQGLNFVLLFAIARVILPMNPGLGRFAACMAIALTGMVGAGSVSELGTTYGDNILSLLVLGSLLVTLGLLHQLSSLSNIRSDARAVLAGLMMGLAVGLKLTVVVFAVGFCAAFLVIHTPVQARVRMGFWFGIGVLVGAGITYGFWFHELWVRFGNPVFPYFNNIFQSSFASTGADYRDVRFLPGNWIEALSYPFIWTMSPNRVAEIPFRDLRFALVYVLAILFATKWAYLKIHTSYTSDMAVENNQDAAVRYLFAAIIISYVTWLFLFAIYRYLVPIEMLAPLCIWLIVGRLVNNPKYAVRASVAFFLLILGTLKPIDWGRAEWGAQYMDVAKPTMDNPDQALVLMAGHAPIAYAVPFFPSSVPFVRIQSNLSLGSGKLEQQMRERIAEHRGALYLLHASYEQDMASVALDAFELKLQRPAECQDLKVHFGAVEAETLRLCRIEKS